MIYSMHVGTFRLFFDRFLRVLKKNYMLKRTSYTITGNTHTDTIVIEAGSFWSFRFF